MTTNLMVVEQHHVMVDYTSGEYTQYKHTHYLNDASHW